MALSSRWTRVQGALQAEIVLAGFADVRMLVQELMALAERLDHHPEDSFGYRRVSVSWTTHDAGGVTALDEQAAAETDRLFARFGAD